MWRPPSLTEVLLAAEAALGSGLLLLAIYIGLVSFWVQRDSLKGPVAVDLVVALSVRRHSPCSKYRLSSDHVAPNRLGLL